MSTALPLLENSCMKQVASLATVHVDRSKIQIVNLYLSFLTSSLYDIEASSASTMSPRGSLTLRSSPASPRAFRLLAKHRSWQAAVLG